MNMFKYLLPLFAVAVLAGIVAADTSSTASQINASLCAIKGLIEQILPTVAFLMLLMAGLVYAAGQAFGAEMKAKAQGWAMSMLVGAIIGLLLAVLAPTLLGIFWPQASNAQLCK